jgi:small subunit ribosomal protein S16
MLVIRLNRTGRRNRAFFRLAVQEKTIAPGGRHTEIVGSWNPHKKEGVFKKERILHWISQGAQPSDTVFNLLVSQGIIEGKKRSIKMDRPEPKVVEEAEEVKPESTESAPSEKVESSETKKETA